MSKILSGEELCHVEGQDNNKPCAATPPESLRQHLMDPNVPKSELEWYAARKLKEAEKANESLRERVEKLEVALHHIANRDGVPPAIEALVALEADHE